MIKAEPPTYGRLRMTNRVQEALARAGNTVERDGDVVGLPAHIDPSLPPSMQLATYDLYRVTLRRPPKGLVLVLIGYGVDPQHHGLRMGNEPSYPNEWADEQGVSWYDRGSWVPCPTCGGALVWYEAGYVPGYRLCTRGHHAQLSSDGRSAEAC